MNTQGDDAQGEWGDDAWVGHPGRVTSEVLVQRDAASHKPTQPAGAHRREKRGSGAPMFAATAVAGVAAASFSSAVLLSGPGSLSGPVQAAGLVSHDDSAGDGRSAAPPTVEYDLADGDQIAALGQTATGQTTAVGGQPAPLHADPALVTSPLPVIPPLPVLPLPPAPEHKAEQHDDRDEHRDPGRDDHHDDDNDRPDDSSGDDHDGGSGDDDQTPDPPDPDPTPEPEPDEPGTPGGGDDGGDTGGGDTGGGGDSGGGSGGGGTTAGR